MVVFTLYNRKREASEITKQEKPTVTIKDISETRYYLDMRGIYTKWSERLDLLHKIIDLAAPKATSKPTRPFSSFYFCKNGYWSATESEKSRPISVFDIDLSEASE